MSTFELDTPTEAKLTDYDSLSDKDREPDANPGAALAFTMTLPNTVLPMFDGFLRGMLFQAPPPASGTQQSLDGDGLTELTPIAKALGQFNWEQELTGYELTFDYGLAGKSNFALEDVKLSDWKLLCKPGSVIVKVKAEAPDVPEKIHGKLAMLKSQPVKILLTAPVVQQGDIEEEHAAPDRTSAPRQEQTPESALAASVNGGAPPPDAPTDLAPSAAWPFPTNTNVKKPDVSVKRGRTAKA